MEGCKYRVFNEIQCSFDVNIALKSGRVFAWLEGGSTPSPSVESYMAVDGSLANLSRDYGYIARVQQSCILNWVQSENLQNPILTPGYS